jgi:hypothetical protein
MPMGVVLFSMSLQLLFKPEAMRTAVTQALGLITEHETEHWLYKGPPGLTISIRGGRKQQRGLLLYLGDLNAPFLMLKIFNLKKSKILVFKLIF